MGLSNFPSPAEGLLPLLVMNAVMSVALVKNMLRSVLLQVVGAGNQDYELKEYSGGGSAARRVSITSYGSLSRNRSRCITGSDHGGSMSASGSGDREGPGIECCVCLCMFEADEEVTELSCEHFFHKGCLDKWFDNQHISCPLCRSKM